MLSGPIVCQNGQKTAESCKTALPSFFRAGYGNFGRKNPNYNGKAEDFHCMHVLVFQGLLRQHSTTPSELSQRTGLLLCLRKTHPPCEPNPLSCACGRTSVTRRSRNQSFNAKCAGPAQHAVSTVDWLGHKPRWRCGGLDNVAPQRPPQQRNDLNFMPNNKTFKGTRC